MSGGVDSSVAAMLLRAAGHQAVGVSMQVWDYRKNGGCQSRATCCAPDDFTDARLVAARIGIPYYVFDFEDNFRHEVIDRFVASYQKGITPNPCVDCNSRVKFKELRDRAESLGCGIVATGHYARIENSQGGHRLLRGIDRAKDQSYFLYGLRYEQLAKTIFPVGAMTKQEVRQHARQFGLVTAEKAESQDICFVSGSLSDFLVKLGTPKKRGKFISRAGQVLGEHDGVHNFTVGQRRGLNIGGSSEPLYVLELDISSNNVIVGQRSELARQEFFVRELNWIAPEITSVVESEERPDIEVIVQVRSRHEGTPARLNFIDRSTVKVIFLEEGCAISPGQAAVFYTPDNLSVLGGGRIVRDQECQYLIDAPKSELKKIA